MDGEEGDDALFGGYGDDTMHGRAGDDFLAGGTVHAYEYCTCIFP